MYQKGGYFRYFTACLICFSLLFYNFYLTVNSSSKKEEIELVFNDNFSVFSKEEEEKEEQNETVLNSEPPAEPPKSESVVTTTTGAVKGKILSQYISPYKASLSYNHTYVKNSTPLKIDVKELLNGSLKFKMQKNSSPEVLILHTHTTECFMETNDDFYTAETLSRNTDNNKNMAKIGETVAQKLNEAGIKTLHDKTQHDYPEYTGSYSRAAKTINSYLKKYPSIKVVIDLHRDSVTSGNDKVKLVTEINGKKAAQVMLVMGSQSGTVTNYPNWKENLKLALKLQQTMEIKYPTLARPLMLMSKSYNQPLSSGAMLIEIGTDANTLSEALYSAELVGDSLASLLNTLN